MKIHSRILWMIPTCIVMTYPMMAYAAIITTGIPGCNFVTGQIQASCIPLFVAHILQQIFQFCGGISLLVIMWGGYELALGDLVGGREKGRSRILWAAVGLVVCITSYFILDFIIAALHP